MKYTTLKTVAKLSLLVMLVVGSVSAQSNTHLRVNIPFDFAAGKAQFKAGDYFVSRFSESILLLRGIHDGTDTLVFAPNKLQRPDTSLLGKLVFHRYGNRYFLAEVWTNRNTVGRSVNKSGTERELAQQLAKVKMQTELVEVRVAPTSITTSRN